MTNPEIWPDLPLAEWHETCATLHLWTQMVGKIRLARMPLINHWWQVPLYVTSRGLTTSPIPDGGRSFEIDFDFIDHRLTLRPATAPRRHLRCGRIGGRFLRRDHAGTADARARCQDLDDAGRDRRPDPVRPGSPHAAYDPDYANRFWRVLVQADRVLTEFRAGFLGKVSPVHFFWGSFDLAVTRFSGRRAPPHPGAPNIVDRVTREAYSHEVSSCGFWPGGAGLEQAVFYSYAYPQPTGFAEAAVRPAAAFLQPRYRRIHPPL